MKLFLKRKNCKALNTTEKRLKRTGQQKRKPNKNLSPIWAGLL
jgi:hypothetical protein